MAKRALVVGIGPAYADTKSSYRSLVAEKNITRIMERLKVKGWDSIDPFPEKTATKSNIITCIKELQQKSSPGDVMLFYYYGHADKSIGIGTNEGSDVQDEYLVTYDNLLAKRQGPYPMKIFLSDNDYLEIMLPFLQKNPKVTLVSIFDCCFSLGMLDGGLNSMDNHLVMASSPEILESWANSDDGSYFSMAMYAASRKNNADYTTYFKEIEDYLVSRKYPKPFLKTAKTLSSFPLIL